MTRKPTVAKGYSSETAFVVYSTALYLATKLGDLRDEIVVVGGLVPSLLIPQSASATDRPPHVGTMDVGLAIALLDQQRYHELCERLRGAGFEPDTNDAGNATSQRWRINADGHRVTVDFLIPATSASDKGGTLRHLEAGFAAVVMPGLELAFADRQLVTLTGDTVHHEQATREIWVCGAGASLSLRHWHSTIAVKTRMRMTSFTYCKTMEAASMMFSSVFVPCCRATLRGGHSRFSSVISGEWTRSARNAWLSSWVIPATRRSAPTQWAQCGPCWDSDASRALASAGVPNQRKLRSAGTR